VRLGGGEGGVQGEIDWDGCEEDQAVALPSSVDKVCAAEEEVVFGDAGQVEGV
jgi:hypothetical protein